jgi:hypothetical protein
MSTRVLSCTNGTSIVLLGRPNSINELQVLMVVLMLGAMT